MKQNVCIITLVTAEIPERLTVVVTWASNFSCCVDFFITFKLFFTDYFNMLLIRSVIY